MKKLSARSATAAALLATTLLAGCGGGGDGDGGIPVLADYAVAAGYKNILAANKSWTLTGAGSDSRTYNATLALQALGSGVFPPTGATAARAQQTLSLSVAAPQPVSTPSTVVGYYDAASGTLLGSIDSDDGTCSRVTTSTALPASASTGAGGALNVEAELASCTAGAATTATTTNRWSLEAARGSDGSVFALLCQNASITATASAPAGSVSTCFEISASGALGNRARLVISIPSLPFNLTATNY